MWEIAITCVGLVAATIAVYYSAIQLKYNREQEVQDRNESLLQIIDSLKSELEGNLHLLKSEQYRIWAETPKAANGNIVILVKPLKTSTFELISGREDLKFLKPKEALSLISIAYDYIKEFNNILECWLRRGVFQEGKAHYSFQGEVDISVPTTEYLEKHKNDTIIKIEKALTLIA
jgi:hypothetical protein